MSLFKPRATLGQRQFLIKPKITYKYTTIQWQNHTTTIQENKQDETHPGDGLTPRRDWAAGLSGLPPDVRNRRMRMPVERTSPSTRHGETTDVPLGDGDSDRDAAHSRSDWLSSRSSTTASTRLHCRPTVPVLRSSRGPSGNLQPRSGCLSSRSRRQRNYYNYKTAPTHPVTITMPAPHQSVFYRLDALPATQPTVSKH